VSLPSWVRNDLARYGVEDESRLELHESFWRHYESRGLIRGDEPRPIQTPSSREHICWCSETECTGDGQKFGISLPWIGRRYRESRLLVLAENIRGGGEGGLMTQHDVVRRLSDHLGLGETPDTPSPFKIQFFLRTLQAAVQILRVQRGQEPATWISRADRLRALQEIALLEAVKCQTDAAPSPWMWEACPEKIGLPDELQLLAPGVVMVLGRPTRRLVKRLYGLSASADRSVERCEVDLDWGETTVIVLPHPMDRQNWDTAAQVPLETILRARGR
jgi:hypothetical protein